MNCWILLYRSMHSGIDTVTEQHWNSKILHRLNITAELQAYEATAEYI